MTPNDIKNLTNQNERISAAVNLLSDIREDIFNGTYGEPGKPNIQSVLHVLVEDWEFLQSQNIAQYINR